MSKDFIIQEFYKRMRYVSLDIYGLLDANMKIHTLGTDSKMIGRIFEMFAQPVLEDIAKSCNLILETPSSQNVYPDFIMMNSKQSKEKIAIDVKSTYVNTDKSPIKFTLGSFASYMRNNTKNIEYEYTDYIKHYVIGFVYKRNGEAQDSKVYDCAERYNINIPYHEVKYFIQEKYKIAGDKPGSGNTENIGSFKTNNFEELKHGMGLFATLGQDVYDLYWKYYPKYRAVEKEYTSLEEFLKWFPQNSKSLKLLHPYSVKSVLRKISEYRNFLENEVVEVANVAENSTLYTLK